MEKELKRLVLREGFRIRVGSWEEAPIYFTKSNFEGNRGIARVLRKAPADEWVGFQLFYAMDENEVRSTTGHDLVESMMAVFEEVTPVMNLCMQIRLE